MSPTVVHPRSCNNEASRVPRTIGDHTSRDPWCIGHKPVNSDAIDGVVRGNGAVALSKRTPSSAMELMNGVSLPTRSARSVSTLITMMSGRSPSRSSGTGSGRLEAGGTSASATAMR